MTFLTESHFKDIFIHNVLPFFSKYHYHNLCCTSNSLCRYLAIFIETDKTDYTLTGKEITVTFDDTTSALDYLRFKTRQCIFKKNPRLLSALNEVRLKHLHNAGQHPAKPEYVQFHANPEDLQSWINYTIANKDEHLPPAAVLFDCKKSLLKAKGITSLGDALNREIWECPPDLRLIKAILSSHDKSNTIKGSGMFGLGRPLVSAIFRAKNLPIVKAIFKHENAKDIPATGIFSLASAIKAAIDIPNVEMVGEILAQPNAMQIPPNGPYGYLSCIKKAEGKSTEIHKLLVTTFTPAETPLPTPKEN